MPEAGDIQQRHLHELRQDYAFFAPQDSRWNDNDPYGHINNAVYYQYFDSAVNRFLIESGRLDIGGAEVIGVVVESLCRYRQPVAYPAPLEVGVRVNRLGQRSVEYGVAVFQAGKSQASAMGYFTHVFVHRQTLRPVAIPEQLKAALTQLRVAD